MKHLVWIPVQAYLASATKLQYISHPSVASQPKYGNPRDTHLSAQNGTQDLTLVGERLLSDTALPNQHFHQQQHPSSPLQPTFTQHTYKTTDRPEATFTVYPTTETTSLSNGRIHCHLCVPSNKHNGRTSGISI